MLLATWNAFTLPVELSFEPEFSKSKTNTIINAIIDLIFLLDILIVFRTYILGDGGKLVTDQKTIAL